MWRKPSPERSAARREIRAKINLLLGRFHQGLVDEGTPERFERLLYSAKLPSDDAPHWMGILDDRFHETSSVGTGDSVVDSCLYLIERGVPAWQTGGRQSNWR